MDVNGPKLPPLMARGWHDDGHETRRLTDGNDQERYDGQAASRGVGEPAEAALQAPAGVLHRAGRQDLLGAHRIVTSFPRGKMADGRIAISRIYLLSCGP